jgi:hypothetical protein
MHFTFYQVVLAFKVDRWVLSSVFPFLQSIKTKQKLFDFVPTTLFGLALSFNKCRCWICLLDSFHRCWFRCFCSLLPSLTLAAIFLSYHCKTGLVSPPYETPRPRPVPFTARTSSPLPSRFAPALIAPLVSPWTKMESRYKKNRVHDTKKRSKKQKNKKREKRQIDSAAQCRARLSRPWCAIAPPWAPPLISVFAVLPTFSPLSRCPSLSYLYLSFLVQYSEFGLTLERERERERVCVCRNLLLEILYAHIISFEVS